MIKLFKRIEGSLHYHEAWVSDGMVIEHWGRVGDRGAQREHRHVHGRAESAVCQDILREARNSGFAPIDESELATVLIEYVVDGMGTSQHLDKRHALQEYIDEILGWTGLGHCDGGSIGSGTMEVCCLVVDVEVAMRTIEVELKGTSFENYSRIFEE